MHAITAENNNQQEDQISEYKTRIYCCGSWIRESALPFGQNKVSNYSTTTASINLNFSSYKEQGNCKPAQRGGRREKKPILVRTPRSGRCFFGEDSGSQSKKRSHSNS